MLEWLNDISVACALTSIISAGLLNSLNDKTLQRQARIALLVFAGLAVTAFITCLFITSSS